MTTKNRFGVQLFWFAKFVTKLAELCEVIGRGALKNIGNSACKFCIQALAEDRSIFLKKKSTSGIRALFFQILFLLQSIQVVSTKIYLFKFILSVMD